MSDLYDDIKTRLAEIASAIVWKSESTLNPDDPDHPTITEYKIRGFAQAPQNIPDSDLPVMLFFIGPAVNDLYTLGPGEDLETRDILCRLYVSPIGAGLDGEAESKVQPFFNLIRPAFNARPALSSPATGALLPRIRRSRGIVSDGGVAIFPAQAPTHIGIEFRLRLEIQNSYTFAQGE